MCIHMPPVSEQVRQLREGQKRKSEKAQSQTKQFSGTRFVNICLAMCKTSTYTVQLCIVCPMRCLDLMLNNSCIYRHSKQRALIINTSCVSCATPPVTEN